MALVLDRPLGAPGVYREAAVPPRGLTGVRMDVCAFLGVAPRGPAREPVLDPFGRNLDLDPRATRQLRRTVPVAVESFAEYRRLFGGFEGPGLLPYSVASFFEQGGRRAYIARIVHDYGDPAQNAARVAEGTVGGAMTTAGPLILRARSEGTWGNQLRATISFRFSPIRAEALSQTTITVAKGEGLSPGALLRLTQPDGTRALCFVAVLQERGREDRPGTVWEGTLDVPVVPAPVQAEIVTADLVITDGAGSTEAHEALGLSPQHPRWMAGVLGHESQLVFPDASWIEADIKPVEKAAMQPFQGGEDAWHEITPYDFFDPDWTPGDDEPGEGIASLVQLEDLSLLVVPDLYSPEPLAPAETALELPPLAGPTFQRCTAAAPQPKQEFLESDLSGLRLDPQTDLAAIRQWQAKLVDFVAQLDSFIVLLDVPPGLHPRQILAWRAQFDSAYAAAYHPWLKVARRDDRRDRLIPVPPSAVAAGIIAQREIAFGVPFGPANVLAAEIVDVRELVSPATHDELHPLGVNVFLRERDGIQLTAARTLSRDVVWRQLSVRRLITMIRRTLAQQMQWAVFEPNNAGLRAELRHLLETYLRGLYRGGAFRGATEEEAFFVRCDADLNPAAVTDAGQVIAQIGVAPSEPIEFIVLNLTDEGDGTLTLTE